MTNLGLSNRTVRWLGSGGMHWEQLLTELQLNMMFNPRPAMLILSLGGNDLVDIKQAKLMKKIKKDIKYIASIFPNAYIVWSDILPRKAWRDSNESLVKTNQKRKRINRAGRQVADQLPNGKYIIHEIETETNGLFLEDGVHLTPVGNDIFLNTFQEAVNAFFSDASLKMFNSLE